MYFWRGKGEYGRWAVMKNRNIFFIGLTLVTVFGLHGRML